MPKTGRLLLLESGCGLSTGFANLTEVIIREENNTVIALLERWLCQATCSRERLYLGAQWQCHLFEHR